MNFTRLSSILGLAFLALDAAVPRAMAQGTVLFWNRAPGLNTPIYDADGAARLDGLGGLGFVTVLYASQFQSESALIQVGSAVPFQTGTDAGYFNGGTNTITWIPPSSVAYLQVRAWDSLGGTVTTWDAAVAAGARAGKSKLFAVVLGGGFLPRPMHPADRPAAPSGGLPPAVMSGLQSFSVLPPVVTLERGLPHLVTTNFAAGQAGTSCSLPVGRKSYYAFRPTSSGQLAVWSTNSTFDSVVEVFQGLDGAVSSRLDCGQGAAGNDAGVSVPADANGLYLASVAALNGAAGSSQVGFVLTPTPVALTGLTATDKTYDGTTAATITGTPTLSGLPAGVDVTLTGTVSGVFLDKNAGTGKGVTVIGLGLDGGARSNYALNLPSLTASITAKALTVTGITANDKVYDRTPAATLNTGSAALVGVVSGDIVTLNTAGATGAFPDGKVGAGKPVQVSGLTLSGTDEANYALIQPSATASILSPEVRIAHHSLANSEFTVSFETLNGLSYTLEFAEQLPSSAWAAAHSATGTGQLMTLADTGASVATRYYRIRCE